MSQPASGSAAAPPLVPASNAMLFLAGVIDQVVMVAAFLACLGTGLLAADSGYNVRVSVIAGAASGVLVALACLAIQFAVGIKMGATAGLFILGIRFNPAEPLDWFDDVGDWLLYFWRNLLLAPFLWALFTLFPPREDTPALPCFVRDPRAYGGGARVARCLLVAALCASPLPFVAAVLR